MKRWDTQCVHAIIVQYILSSITWYTFYNAYTMSDESVCICEPVVHVPHSCTITLLIFLALLQIHVVLMHFVHDISNEMSSPGKVCESSNSFKDYSIKDYSADWASYTRTSIMYCVWLKVMKMKLYIPFKLKWHPHPSAVQWSHLLTRHAEKENIIWIECN